MHKITQKNEKQRQEIPCHIPTENIKDRRTESMSIGSIGWHTTEHITTNDGGRFRRSPTITGGCYMTDMSSGERRFCPSKWWSN